MMGLLLLLLTFMGVRSGLRKWGAMYLVASQWWKDEANPGERERHTICIAGNFIAVNGSQN